MGIAHLIGRDITPEKYENLSDEEKLQLAEAHYSLRRFGYGPYVAFLEDASGTKHKLAYTGYSERMVQGVAHIVQRVVGMIQRMPGKFAGVEAVLDSRTERATALQYELNKLKNYRVHYSMLGDLGKFLDLDLKTTKITILNNNKQVVYKSAA